jgi:hypothetical protein
MSAELPPAGAVGYFFLHRFSDRAVKAEAHAAGFRRVEQHQAHYLACVAPPR